MPTKSLQNRLCNIITRRGMCRFWERTQHKCLHQLPCIGLLQGKKAKKAAASEQLDVEADAEEEAELARMREAGFATGTEATGAAAPAVWSVQRPSAGLSCTCSGGMLCNKAA
jgi:hypothetical protein